MNNKAIGIGLGAFSFGALAVFVGVALGRDKGFKLHDRVRNKLPASLTAILPGASVEGHVPTDLLAGTDLGPDHRAPVAFRPDMEAPMTAEEREALRPATGPSPSMVADEGSGFAEEAGAA